ncbi:hypothetical protein OsJ_26599 [Oryza sativa Japonica Group]|uniref:Uncharacterized protein n=1 Tax=Oryza sativa subsp. japonica TaxID=39947 RepID=A3BR51_ORYSJ|nr:hypothetical protein OsJ_26599 [Oryza sativa Japonica Group]
MERGAERGGERGAAGVGGDVNRGGGGVMVEIGGGLAARERERREIRAGEAWAGMGEGVRLRDHSVLKDAWPRGLQEVGPVTEILVRRKIG